MVWADRLTAADTRPSNTGVADEIRGIITPLIDESPGRLHVQRLRWKLPGRKLRRARDRERPDDRLADRSGGVGRRVRGRAELRAPPAALRRGGPAPRGAARGGTRGDRSRPSPIGRASGWDRGWLARASAALDGVA